MLIVVKDENKFLLGITIRDCNIDTDTSDLVLEDNMPVWSIKGKDRVLVACAFRTFSSTQLKFNKKLFDFDINDTTMFGEFIDRLKDFLKNYDLIDSDGNWDNELIVVKGKDCYHISRRFIVTKCTDYCYGSSYGRYFIGSLESSKEQPTETRIKKAYKLLGKMKRFELFPLSIYDSKTGKRKVVYK